MYSEPLPAPVPEKRHSDFTDRVVRVRRFEQAATFVGQDRLAAMTGMAPRTLRAKLDGSRSLSDADLARASAALERVASEMINLAAELRALSRGSNGR